MISSMAKELNLGLMVPGMRESTLMARRKAKENCSSQTAQYLKETSAATKSMGSVSTTGLMGSVMRVTGSTIKCAEKEN